MTLYALSLYPDSVYAYCTVCKMTCLPREFIKADRTVHLVCPRCVGEVPEVEGDDVPEDDDEDDKPQGSICWPREFLDAVAGLQAISYCLVDGCRTKTLCSCLDCGDPTCSQHLKGDSLCDSCYEFDKRHGPFRQRATGK